MQRLRAMDGNEKCAVFLTNLSPLYHIYIVSFHQQRRLVGKSGRDHCPGGQNERPLRCRPWLKNVACFKLPIIVNQKPNVFHISFTFNRYRVVVKHFFILKNKQFYINFVAQFLLIMMKNNENIFTRVSLFEFNNSHNFSNSSMIIFYFNLWT